MAVAPIKALCSERQEDWQAKFGALGLRCIELTGDSQLDDYFELQNAQIVATTPVRMLPSPSSHLLYNCVLSASVQHMIMTACPNVTDRKSGTA